MTRIAWSQAPALYGYMATTDSEHAGVESSDLPHGATRMDLGGATLIFLRDKLVLAPSGSETHFTVHFGPVSGVIDIHATTQRGPDKSWERLYSIEHKELAHLLLALGQSTLANTLSLIRPLRPGWMVRRQIGGVLGLNPSGDDLRRVTKRGPKRKLIVDHEAFAARIVVPEWIDELYSLGNGELFTLVDCRRPLRPRCIGLGFTVTASNGSMSLRWVKYRDIGRLCRDFRQPLLELATRYGTLHKPLPWITQAPA